MNYINNQYDVTLSPINNEMIGYQNVMRNGKTFSEAANINHIYKNNGLICQKKMCESMTGCSSRNGCPENPEWNKIIEFCGGIGTGGIYMDGSYWTLHNIDEREKMLKSTEKQLGMKVLPNPYNVVGMY
jgi:hypothetical protein